MVQHAWSNGHAICKDLGSSPTYNQWSFSPVKRFLHSIIDPNANICAMRSNILSQSQQEHIQSHQTKKNTQGKRSCGKYYLNGYDCTEVNNSLLTTEQKIYNLRMAPVKDTLIVNSQNNITDFQTFFFRHATCTSNS